MRYILMCSRETNIPVDAAESSGMFHFVCIMGGVVVVVGVLFSVIISLVYFPQFISLSSRP